jgi:hypothetical protein
LLTGDISVFLYGFAKNEKENIDEDEFKTLKEIGVGWLKANKESLEKAIKAGIIEEVICEDKENKK